MNSHPNDDGKSYSNKGEPDDDNDKEDDENVKKDEDIENQDDYDNENNKKIRVICYCWGNSSIPEGRFSKWF